MEEVTDPALLEMLEAKAAPGAPVDIGAENRSRVQLQALGLPVLRAELDPLMRISDAKQKAIAAQRLLASGQTALEKANPSVNAYQAMETARQFRELMPKVPQGGLGGLWAARAPAWMKSGDAVRMGQISAEAARTMRQPGEGHISDFDARQFLKMVGSPENPKPANAMWATALERRARNAIDYQNFREAFLSANQSLIGADRLWKQYVNANPIFTKDGKLNSSRQTWDEYFSSRARARLSGSDPEMKRRESDEPRGVVRISTDDEYDALPSGTEFIGPDMKRRRKP